MKKTTLIGTKISLEFEEAYVWEVLDAISEQLKTTEIWKIQKNDSSSNYNYRVDFHWARPPMKRK